MSESYQWLITCLNHIQTYYQSLVWFRYIISYWYDSDILSVIRMIQTYHQSLVWFRHTISHWNDSELLSVIGMILPITDNITESYQWLMICLNHTNDWWYVWIIPMTDSISESYQWLIVYEWLVWFRYIISHWFDSDISSVIGMIQTYY
jgi:hypothetical protein